MKVNKVIYMFVFTVDHSRVKLQNAENDYINASLVVMEEAQRSYILTQGPLRNTCDHFWLMIWEQKSRAVIMLNRVIEKGSNGLEFESAAPSFSLLSEKDTQLLDFKL
ncbi:UNVERIFIED_CONTAM: hypothetical protein FKN15_047635 [Acipenser sinensis]